MTEACVPIVEDETLLAFEFDELFNSASANVIGPFANLVQATQAARGYAIDVAILNTNLNDEMVYPLAEEMTTRRIPFLFLTGYDAYNLPDCFRAVPRMSRPFDRLGPYQSSSNGDEQSGLELLAASRLFDILPPATALHALTTGAIGTMTLAVMTRASLGHTGRPLVAGRGTITIYVLITVAAVLRLIAPLDAAHYMLSLTVAGAAWTAAFGLFVLLYGRALAQPRAKLGSSQPI